MIPIGLSSLRDHLLHERIAGHTLTPRESVVGNAEQLAAGDPDKMFGLDFAGLTAQEALDAVAAMCGCSNDPTVRSGHSYIDPDRTLEELGALGRRLAGAVDRGDRVLLATGHPAGMLPFYMSIARHLVSSGCKVATPRSGERLGEDPAGRNRTRIRYPGGVACLTDGISLLHTHEAWPMERILEAGEAVDLVVADHGYAGAAIAAGLETVSVADVNDPALAVAKARGLTDVVVPMDDNLDPELYSPLVWLLTGRPTEQVRSV